MEIEELQRARFPRQPARGACTLDGGMRDPCPTLSLDVDPYLLNFLNGAVDLRTGELRPHDRADPITKLLALILLRQ